MTENIMVNKILLTIALMSSSMWANEHNGTYLGISGSITNLTGELSKKNDIIDEKYIKIGKESISPGLFAGYGGNIGNSPFYIGGNVFFKYEGNNSFCIRKSYGNRNNINFSLKNTIGGYVNFGISLNKFLIIGKYGLISSNYRFGYHYANNDSTIKSSNIKGKSFGGEIAYLITPNFISSIEVTNNTYSNIRLYKNNTTVKFSPKTINFSIKLSYLF
jgi:hypothetical protein